jgi:hypothetical protein
VQKYVCQIKIASLLDAGIMAIKALINICPLTGLGRKKASISAAKRVDLVNHPS